MKTYKFDEQQSILWSEQLDENTRQSGFIRVGKTEQRDTGELDDKGDPILETVDVYQELIDSGVEIAPFDHDAANAEQAKAEAIRYLNSTDWYYARLSETGKQIPDDVTEKREAARALL